MTIQLIMNRPEENRPKTLKGEPATLCDTEAVGFEENSIRMIKPVDLDTIRSYHARYEAMINGLPSSVDDFKSIALQSANFPIADIKAMIEQNGANMKFVRLYVGVDSNGNQLLLMAPVDVNMRVITEAGTFYSEQCCGYPPHMRNFESDPILHP